jgi:acyl transferase domain-containing protein
VEGLYRGEVKAVRTGLAGLARDEEFAQTLRRWIERGKLGKVLEVWSQGLDVDWRSLYADGPRPRRIALPSYPFARKRYWAPDSIEVRIPSVEPRADASPQYELLVRDWSPAPRSMVDAIPHRGALLILATPATAALTAAVRSRLAPAQVLVVQHRATPPDGFDFYDASAASAAYAMVQQHLATPLHAVIDLCAYDASYEDSLLLEAGKLHLLQLLVDQARTAGLTFIQLTHNLSDCPGGMPTLQGARMLGVYRSLPAEYRQLRTLRIDSDESLDQPERIADLLLAEMAVVTTADTTAEIAYRSAVRMVPGLRSLPTPPAAPITYVHEDAVVITGGTGGLGAAVAEHAVAHGARRLVLFGRETLPPRDQWEEAAREARGTQRAKLERLLALVARGVDVQYHATLLEDADGVRRVIAGARATARIRAVFHCAGSLGNAPAFIRKQPADMQQVASPKLAGLRNLHDALRDDPPEHLVVFSSVAAVAPALAAGQIDYALANAYADCYVERERASGCSYLRALQWPQWSETGMAAGQAASAHYRASGLATLTTREGLALLDCALEHGVGVAVPCIRTSEAGHPSRLLQLPSIPRAAILPDSQQTLPRNEAFDLESAMYRWLRAALTVELGLADHDLEDDKRFEAYGVDSILIAQLMGTLQRGFSQPLDPAMMFEHATLRALTRHLAARDDVHHAVLAPVDPPTRIPLPPAQPTMPAAPVPEQAVSTEPQLRSTMTPDGYQQIAVVGIACRMPGAPDQNAFWTLLAEGRSAIEPLPAGRWEQAGESNAYGGWLDDVDAFDARYFRIKDEDAAIMDPQARILLEQGLAALHDAGYDAAAVGGHRVGVYVGGRAHASAASFDRILQAPNPILGLGQNYLATNLSRFFNLAGPSLVLDTACSSALVCLSTASEALRAGTIDMAMVGSVSLLMDPRAHQLFEARNILNRDGEFHVFDRNASGEVLGEGAGMVVLKRLDDARRDGDRIYAVVRAVSVNNDGQTLGPGSPNLHAQRRVITDALELAGVRPGDVGYIEANGGGSMIVDSIEIKALAAAYALGDLTQGECVIGSVKPNVGHLLLSSGLAGFVCCVLSVANAARPPFLSAREPFEHFDFAGSRVRFVRRLEQWTVPPGKTRIAAQNSFADGGTNAHVIIEQAPADYIPTRTPLPLPPLQWKRWPMPWADSINVAASQSRHSGAKPAVVNIWGEFREATV